MPYQPQKPEQPPFGLRLPNLLIVLVDGLSYSMEALLHKDIGERRVRDLGGRMLLPVFLLLMAALTGTIPPPGFPADDDPLALPRLDDVRYLAPFFFAGLLILCHLRHAYDARRRRKQGPLIHSYYSGIPRDWRLYRKLSPSLTEEACKRHVEPLVSLGLAFAATLLSPLVGLYLFLGTIALAYTTTTLYVRLREQAADTTDGFIDMLALQDNVVERYAPEPAQVPAAQVVVPAARHQPPSPPPQAAQVPPPLTQGLDPNLVRLLQEHPCDE